MLNSEKSIRIDRKAAATILGCSVRTLIRKASSDPGFPQERKDGKSRNAKAFLLRDEVEAYAKRPFEIHTVE